MGLKLLFVIFFFFSRTFAQDADIVFKNITIDDGLSQNSVVDIAQDDMGFIWFATQDGLNRYDGKAFKIFPEIFDDITSPNYSRLGKLFTSKNRLWFVSKGGQLKVMDLCTEDIFPIERLESGLNLPPVSTVLEDIEGNLWIGTLEEGVFKWDVDRISYQQFSVKQNDLFTVAGSEVRSIFEDNSRDLWILTENGVTNIRPEQNKNYLKGINTNVISEDLEGRLWIGTFGEGLFIRDPGARDFKLLLQYGEDDLPADLVIEAIHADREGNVWIGTYGNGLYLLHKNLQRIFHFMPERRNPFSIGFQDILSIKEDKEGAIWIGTDGGGISYYNSHFHNFKRLTGRDVSEEISIRQIRAIATDRDENIWLGTSGKGLTYLSADLSIKKTFHLKPYQPGIANYDRIVSLYVDPEGDLWIGTQGNGLLIRDVKTGDVKKWFFSTTKTSPEYIADNTIWSIMEAGPQRVFAATRNAGVLLIDKKEGLIKTFPSYSKARQSPEKMNIRSITRVNDSILALGAEEGAIHLLNTCKGEFQKLNNPVIEESLDDNYGIKSLYYKDGLLWVGTAGRGLLVTHLKSGKTTSLTTKHGLPNGMIYGIIPEGNNSLWMSSNRGVFRLSYELVDNTIKVVQIKSFTVGDGLQSNEFNTGAYHQSEDGTNYFGGINGLNFFDPGEVMYAREQSKVVLTGAMVHNSPLQTDSLITYKTGIKLPYRQNSVSFNYTVLDFLSPETMNYEYKLEGYDEQWINAGNRQYTAYTNLPPGDYTFMVKPAENIDSEAAPATLGISISAPFWLKWWFFILFFALISGALYIFYRYRINQLLEVQRVKNNISADLHDDIGSRLTSIQFLSALSRKKWMNKEDTSDCLMGIDEEVQASAEALNEIVWNIKMDDESLEDIVAKMRRYAGEALDPCEILYRVKIDTDFSRKKMKMQKRREIFLIYKELLNNVRKHARASKVKIKISIMENMFFLSVRDDGQGFDPSMDTSRNGLKNVGERVMKWNGKIRISSAQGQGSVVKIWLPFDRLTFLRKVFGTLKKRA
ncbi:ligand-binding sensor domain-containing protein [Salinimicrobium xinjiangense]|uniref:ligand-binding sensor domain-containing protein n=1 Tax=Salinimicrobium xinjiangense TaxID=438596 RepID=UPI000405E9DE|nr:sensor histidine kinase [Salinimicrobium xinjiangense]